jgi:putative transposase
MWSTHRSLVLSCDSAIISNLIATKYSNNFCPFESSFRLRFDIESSQKRTMGNSYTQLHIHLVFAVKYREAAVKRAWKEDLHRYLTGIVQNNGHKMLAVHSMEDHTHILLGLRPRQSISDLMQDVKSGSSKWINENRFCKGKFSWQEGFGAFSVSKFGVPIVTDYIRNQEEHHRKKTFIDEYKELLKENDIEYDERYIFHCI